MKLFCVLVLLIANGYFVGAQGLRNQSFVKALNGKPIKFYLDHPDIDQNAKKFYNGEFKVSDDDATFGMIKKMITNDRVTGPFYFFLFNRLVDISDGALAEAMTEYSRMYLEKYPCYVISNLKTREYNVDTEKWASFVSFSLYDLEAHNAFSKKVEADLNKNCASRISDWKKVKERLYYHFEHR